MEVDLEMLERAMKKAVEVGLLPKTATMENYLARWEQMRQVLMATLEGKE